MPELDPSTTIGGSSWAMWLGDAQNPLNETDEKKLLKGEKMELAAVEISGEPPQPKCCVRVGLTDRGEVY